MVRIAFDRDSSNHFRDELLDIGAWQIGANSLLGGEDFYNIATFASGKRANNKLIGDLIIAPDYEYNHAVYPIRRAKPDKIDYLREQLLTEYDHLLGTYAQPDTLWGVPNGGQKFAELRAQRLGLNFVRLAKVETDEPGNKFYQPATDADAEVLANARYMVASEDVGSTGTSLYGAMYESDDYGLQALRVNTVGVDFVWIRGTLSSKFRNVKIAKQTIVHEPIPNQIRRSDDFYQRFGELAIVQFKYA